MGTPFAEGDLLPRFDKGGPGGGFKRLPLHYASCSRNNHSIGYPSKGRFFTGERGVPGPQRIQQRHNMTGEHEGKPRRFPWSKESFSVPLAEFQFLCLKTRLLRTTPVIFSPAPSKHSFAHFRLQPSPQLLYVQFVIRVTPKVPVPFCR